MMVTESYIVAERGGKGKRQRERERERERVINRPTHIENYRRFKPESIHLLMALCCLWLAGPIISI